MMKPVPNLERRCKARLPYVCPISVKDSASGANCSARIFNQSEAGIFFESDALFEKGAEVYIGLPNPSFGDFLSDYAFYRAAVVWRNELGEDSHFIYGYGARIVSPTRSEKAKISRDLRRHPRRPIKRAVRFSADRTIGDGLVTDISLAGVFVKTGKKLRIGQLISLQIPDSSGRDSIVQAKVVWSNADGFGLQFADN